MPTPRRSFAAILLVVTALAVAAGFGLWWVNARRQPAEHTANRAQPRELVATLRSDPPTFNRYAGNAYPTALLTHLTQASLVRINRLTDRLEPWLAESWSVSPDRREYTLKLREGVRFSDGAPFTADDVVFSFEAAYDAPTASSFSTILRVDGQPLRVQAPTPSSVRITFPAPSGQGLRILDGFPIYPKHRLAPALAAGAFRQAWGPTTPPGEIVGLGPFSLDRYEPGQRVVLSRNPHYWRRDENDERLPRLDRLRIELVPEQNSELLRLQSGQVDLIQSELRPEDYAPLKPLADRGRIRLLDVGRSFDTHWLWFNLSPKSGARRPWLKRAEFRRALSLAVDRDRFAETVYLGAAEPAWGPVSPANRSWYFETPRPPFDRDQSRRLLGELGLTDRNADGLLEDRSGLPVRFTVLIQKGVTASEKGMAFVRDGLASIGVGLDVAALDLGGMMARWSKGEYDAIFHMMIATDTDPGGNLDLWLSSGDSHIWNPGQERPATQWERQIDELMRQQVATLDLPERRRLFNEVQRIFAEHSPALVFAVPHVYVATSARVEHVTPAARRPEILWHPDVISVQP